MRETVILHRKTEKAKVLIEQEAKDEQIMLSEVQKLFKRREKLTQKAKTAYK